MSLPRRSEKSPSRLPGWLDDSIVKPPYEPPPARAAAVGRLDWKAWLRALERKRRLLSRRNSERDNGTASKRRNGAEARDYLAKVTHVSFEMDGIELSEHDLASAMAPGAPRRPIRSRQTQRLRNHIAILRRIGLLVRRCQPLDPGAVVRWYTSISWGLSSARLAEPMLARLTRVVRQINSPHLNLRPALEEIARLYVELMSDPIVPSFNGILARLLLACHLARCGLPPILFDPARDRPRPDSTGQLARLLEMVQESYDALLAG